MKTVLLLSFFFPLFAFTQREIKPTSSIQVSGSIKNEVTIDITSLDSFTVVAIPDLIIKNNEGKVKKTATDMKGILLTDLLASVEYVYEKPHELNEFYFVLVASDGFRAVYSWNELYNSETGKHVYLITEKEGQKISEMDERLLIVCTTDTNSGRRYVKGVEKILVQRIP